mmetsp:Transcript_58707/g.188781  ORF Transcript_58707/g.188781 Transcript_58707/m.188781 type:complete len:388 (+) Transcript_58707:68-1231(+)
MGAGCTRSAGCSVQEEDDDQAQEDLPPFFTEILQELERHQRKLGGLRHFQDRPYIERKMKRKELAGQHSDYEYVYLTVLGLAKLHLWSEEIIRKNNGQAFNHNPGVQLLERTTGLTMHAERQGSNHLLRTAPATLVEAFQVARVEPGGALKFFQRAFNRTADPCLEGRVGRIMEWLESRRAASGSTSHSGPPWEEVSLRRLPEDAAAQDVVGEHLRVFMAECTWRWSQERSLDYESAKDLRLGEQHAADFSRLYNAPAFEASMLSRGVATDACLARWESATKAGEWLPYEPDVSLCIEEAHRQRLPEVRVRLGPKSWLYIIDFQKMVQRNAKTGQERLLRRGEASENTASRQGKLTREELSAGIRYFVELATLPVAAPGAECGLPQA